MNSDLHFLIQSHVPQAVSYYNSNLGILDKTIRIAGYPHGVVEEILTGVYAKAEREEIPVQIIHNCLDNSVQGIILPEQSAGVCGTDVYDPEEHSMLALSQPIAFSDILKTLNTAREMYLKAREIHDEQEKVYISNMNFEAADRLTEETIHLLLDGKNTVRSGKGTDRFFGAATVNGNINYIPEVTRDIPKRYLIKGRPGTGKSTFLKKIAAAAISRGFDVEVYHCSLAPSSLDMVAVRELGFCLFDSTAPHEYFPSRPNDEIIDIYQKCVTPGTDEKYQKELDALQTDYKKMLQEAASCLQDVKKACDRFEEALPAVSKADIEDLKQQLLQELF